jgi:hypothetical protein
MNCDKEIYYILAGLLRPKIYKENTFVFTAAGAEIRMETLMTRFSGFLFRQIGGFILFCGAMAFAQENIAVMDLVGKNVSQQDAAIITDKLRSEIIKSKKFGVFERERMNEILKEQGFQQSGVCSSEDCAAQAGNIIGVSRMVVGSIGRVGGSYLIAVRMIDVETGKILRNVDGEFKGTIEDALTSEISAVAQKLLAARDMASGTKKKTTGVPGNFGPSDGLIGYWPLDKVDGNMLSDLSGNGKHGSLFGTKVDVKGGMKFSGSGDYVTLPELALSKEYTVSFWVKPASIADQVWYNALCGEKHGGGLGIAIVSNELHFTAGANCGAQKPDAICSYSMDNIEPGKWHCVTAVFSAGKSMALYVDGKETARLTSGVPSSAGAIATQYFGIDLKKPQVQSYCGKARDILLFDRALETQEIYSLYTAGRNR